MTAPCTWPVSYAGCMTCAALDGLSAPDKANVEAMATTYLWNWTLRQFGVCATALRPCRSDCERASTFWGRGPYPLPAGVSGASSWPWGALRDGQWYGLSCGTCASSECSCASTVSLKLPGPVSAITEVLVDGVALDSSTYRLDNPDLLVRLDGSSWPACQDLTLATTEVGTWQVTYDRGIEVPVGGQIAAGVLACELAKAICRDNSCALPQRLQTITRQGVTMALIDNFSDLEKGRTGIWLIDSWVASIVKPRRGGRVYSVDVSPRGRISSV